MCRLQLSGSAFWGGVVNGRERDYSRYEDLYLGQLIDQVPPEQNPLECRTKVMVSSKLVKSEEVRGQLERGNNGQEKRAIGVNVK